MMMMNVNESERLAKLRADATLYSEPTRDQRDISAIFGRRVLLKLFIYVHCAIM
jgi:hypothetical protein